MTILRLKMFSRYSNKLIKIQQIQTRQLTSKAPNSLGKAAGNKKRGDASMGDPRYANLKRILYEGEGRKSIESNTMELEKREVIERMWALLKEREATAWLQNHSGRYQAIREAMETLKTLDTNLFEAASSRIESPRFPIRMRIPTDTPPSQVWKY